MNESIGAWKMVLSLACVLAGMGADVAGRAARGAEGGPSAEPPPVEKIAEGERAAEDALRSPASGQEPNMRDAANLAADVPRISLWKLYLDGGVLMYPITALSFLVVLFGLERALALRRGKVLPSGLIEQLGRLSRQQGGLDPRAAYTTCRHYPSAAANVIRAMLLKVGRPHAELEQAVHDASQREANKLYRNARWLNLSAGIAPLLGLLGTVQGMIMAFYMTANLPTGVNKARYLAEGIYVALVTTFGGLCVAIPAAMLAHYFEGKIHRLFGELDEAIAGIMPQLERFEGKLRINQEQLESVPPLSASAPAGAGTAAAGQAGAKASAGARR